MEMARSLGHILRKSNNPITKEALFWNPAGKRSRPPTSWRRSRKQQTANKSKWQLFVESFLMLVYIFFFFAMWAVGPLLLLVWSIVSTNGRVFTVLYCIFIYLDRHSKDSGGRCYEWYRNLAWWRYFRSYFPVELHKTADLPADRNYLMAIVPHGIFSFGPFSVLGSNANNFKELYPGITSRLSTVGILFSFPFVRELLLCAGVVTASTESLNWVLNNGTGKALGLVVGGAAEAIHSQPGVYKTVLKHRKGFCRIALLTGALLVPVISFGEVDVYDNRKPKPGSLLNSFQAWVKKNVGFVPLKMVGEGPLGILPKRTPVHVVVGSPIDVKRNENPTKEEVDSLHRAFTSSLVLLFDAEKHKYLEDPNTQLQFI